MSGPTVATKVATGVAAGVAAGVEAGVDAVKKATDCATSVTAHVTSGVADAIESLTSLGDDRGAGVSQTEVVACDSRTEVDQRENQQQGARPQSASRPAYKAPRLNVQGDSDHATQEESAGSAKRVRIDPNS